MRPRSRVVGLGLMAALLSAPSLAQDAPDLAELAARGEELFRSPASCWVCHGDQGEGRVGPSLQFGPTPLDIHEQFETNPQMAALRATLQPDHDDLLAVSVYIRQLNGAEPGEIDVAALRATLDGVGDAAEAGAGSGYFLTERDEAIQEYESFETVLADWERRAATGNIRRDYEVIEAATFDPGEPKFTPEPGKTYFYQNVGYTGMFRPYEVELASSSAVVVGDAETKEIIASYQIPDILRSSVHTTVMSPDGRYVYIIGGRPADAPEAFPSLTSPATILKVDALTLQPIKQLVTGARLHHGQIFQDRYLLLDSFARDEDGLDVYLFDPETDTIVGGVRGDELGGAPYTSWTDDEFIYILMEPLGYGTAMGPTADRTFSGFLAIGQFSRGQLTTLRPFWIAKLDPNTWEVVQEYPYPGYRGDWIAFDQDKEHMFVPAAASGNVMKIDIESGDVDWSVAVGVGPYGANLNADETELWVADKGEGTGMMGRTISVVDNRAGRQIETVFSGYQVDHVLLAPNGREFWATSNGEGRIYVFDADTREQTHVIDMPSFGDPHGLVWVHYDENGEARVVRDQGGFHNGVDPRHGLAPLGGE